MKNSIKIITIILSSLLLLTGCLFCKDNKEAIEFKNSYESVNGKTNARGLAHRTVTIDENNPFVTTNADEIVKMIENKETFFVYFGDKLCPWCRSVIESATKVALENNIDKIYYVAIWDDNGSEILRDKYEISADGTLTKTVEGTESYKKLLTYFSDYLSDYTLTSDGNTVMVGEKRIYAPNFIYVENGKTERLTTAKSDLLIDSRAELTDEIKKDQEAMFKKFYLGNACTDAC